MALVASGNSGSADKNPGLSCLLYNQEGKISGYRLGVWGVSFVLAAGTAYLAFSEDPPDPKESDRLVAEHFLAPPKPIIDSANMQDITQCLSDFSKGKRITIGIDKNIKTPFHSSGNFMCQIIPYSGFTAWRISGTIANTQTNSPLVVRGWEGQNGDQSYSVRMRIADPLFEYREISSKFSATKSSPDAIDNQGAITWIELPPPVQQIIKGVQGLKAPKL